MSTPHKPTRVELLAEHFRAHPHVWIDGVDLERIAGRYAWRSRVSDCRRQLGMTIENRQRWVQTSGFDHTVSLGYTVSEYRFVPPLTDAVVHALDGFKQTLVEAAASIEALAELSSDGKLF